MFIGLSHGGEEIVTGSLVILYANVLTLFTLEQIIGRSWAAYAKKLEK